LAQQWDLGLSVIHKKSFSALDSELVLSLLCYETGQKLENRYLTKKTCQPGPIKNIEQSYLFL